MLKEEKKYRVLRIGIYIWFTCTFIYLYSVLPFCQDDWAWGHPNRLSLIRKLFWGYNGRILGNLFIMTITRIRAVAVLGLPLIVLMLLGTIHKITRNEAEGSEGRNLFLLGLAVFLILAEPLEIYVHTFGWFSGFSNYVPPIVLFLIYFSQIRHTVFEGEEEIPDKTLRWLVPVCFASQLFVEHNTIFHCMFSGCILLYEWFFRNHKVRRSTLYLFGAFAAGFVCMFTNSAYFGALFGKSNTYKRIAFRLSSDFVRFYNMDHIVLNLILTCCCLVLLLKNSRVKGILKAEILMALAGFMGLSLYLQLNPDCVLLQNRELYKWILLGSSFLFDLHVLAAAGLGLTNPKKRYILLFYLMAIAVTVPLVMARPIYPRCFLAGYIYRSIACILLTDCIWKGKKTSLLTLVVFVLCISFSAKYVKAYAENARYEKIRVDISEKSWDSEKKKIVLPYFPHSEYLKDAEPIPQFEMHFKYHYNISQEKKLKFRSYKKFEDYDL